MYKHTCWWEGDLVKVFILGTRGNVVLNLVNTHHMMAHWHFHLNSHW